MDLKKFIKSGLKNINGSISTFDIMNSFTLSILQVSNLIKRIRDKMREIYKSNFFHLNDQITSSKNLKGVNSILFRLLL